MSAQIQIVHEQLAWQLDVEREKKEIEIGQPREVIKTALLSSAASIMLIHNHPSGDPQPSREDREITRRLKEAGDLLGIRVLDHIIIGEQYMSFVEMGLM